MVNPAQEIMRQVKEKLTLERLESIYGRASQSTIPYLFFRSLIEYVSLFEHSEILHAIAQAIVEEGRNQSSPIDELQKITLQEMQHVYVLIKECVAQNSITDGEIAFSLEQLEGQLASNLHPVESRYQALNDLLHMLATGYFLQSKLFITQFAKIAEATDSRDNVIVSTTYGPAYKEWHDAHAQYQRQKLTEAWFSWKEIYDLYLTHHDYEEQRKELSDKGKSLEKMFHSHTFQKIDLLVNDTEQTSDTIEAMELYRTHIELVHFHVQSLLEGLGKNDATEEVTRTKISFHFNTETGVLEINNQSVIFKEAPKSILTILTREPERKWPYDELYESLEHVQITKLEESMKEKIYRTCKAITERIELGTGSKEFLMYKGQIARINPTYLPMN